MLNGVLHLIMHNEAVAWLADEKPDYAIVCATPAVTETVMEQLLTGLP